MAIRILRFGNAINVSNPVLLNAESTDMVDVIWAEIGQRPGANKDISESSKALDIILKQELEEAGVQTSGLDNFRVHTQPVKRVLVTNGHLKLGVEYDGFINRRLHSVPAIKQQQGVLPRMIDGRPTFFTTKIELQPKEDMDERMSNEQLSKLHPEWFDGSIVSQTARTNITGRTSTEDAMHEQDLALANDNSTAEHPLANLEFPG